MILPRMDKLIAHDKSEGEALVIVAFAIGRIVVT